GARARRTWRPRRPPSERDVGRAAAAGRDRPRPGDGAEHPARRRAHGQPRLGDERGDHDALSRASRSRSHDPARDARARRRRARPPRRALSRRLDRRGRDEPGARTLSARAVAFVALVTLAACEQAPESVVPLYDTATVAPR